MNINNFMENRTVLNVDEYKQNPVKRNEFLMSEQDHILHLTARVLKRTVSRSDEEWSIALLAVNEAIDSYEMSRGKFWNYAAMVIGSRIKDYYRSASRFKNEISVNSQAFGEDIDEDESQIGIHIEIRDKTAVYVETDLRDELEALAKELEGYDIDLFELPKYSPKSLKTRETCKEIVAAIFLPPPLIELLKKTRNLPVKEIMNRITVKRKLIDRHRKYLVAASLIEAGDYPHVMSYYSHGEV